LHTPDPTRVLIDGKPWWLFDDGKLLPVIRGGADDGPTDPTDDPDDKGDPKDEPFDEARAKEKIAKANREAANLRARLKEAEEKASKLDELEEAKKSDIDKAKDTAKQLEERASKAEGEALRLRVAMRKGLTDAQAKRLMGATEEELEADADELLATFKTGDSTGDDKDKGPGSRRPHERLRGGGGPTPEPEETDPRKLAEKVPRR
jgi:hypothetical protein